MGAMDHKFLSWDEVKDDPRAREKFRDDLEALYYESDLSCAHFLMMIRRAMISKLGDPETYAKR